LKIKINEKQILEIGQDEYAESPRDWENVGQIIFSHAKYNLGDDHSINFDEFGSWNEVGNELFKDGYFLPVYMYEHGSIALSDKPFSCPYDSGQIGIIGITKEKIKEYFGVNVDLELVKKSLISEIKTYNSFLQGEVYFYNLYDIEKCNLGHEHLEIVDCCSGFYSIDNIIEELYLNKKEKDIVLSSVE